MATTTPSNGGLGTKKSVFVLITVVGCIAILWPKILYFAMFGGQQTSKAFVKDHRGGTGCCDVVLDQDISANISAAIAHPGFRKRLNLMTGEMSLRQERPPHLRPDGIHPAMRERGRAIPVTSTVPIVAEEKPIPTTVKRIVEGRPGPIPGMRPPMGAGSNHQANHKGNSLGFIMPLYTVGIVAFFVYTVMKLVMKKPINNTPYAEAITSKPEFQDQVFGQDKSVYKKSDASLTNLGWKDHDTIVTAIQGLIDAADEQLNKKTNSTNLSKDTTGDHNLHATNGNLKVSPEDSANNVKDDEEVIRKLNEKIKILENGSTKSNDLKTKDIHNDKSVKVMGMETTESCEGGRKWLRPSTPSYHAVNNEKPDAEPQAIFLEGALPHDSQILVADSETKTENVFDDDLDGGKEEPAVVICSKMTLSLINMDPVDKSGRNATNAYDEGDDDDAEIDDDDIEEVEEIEDEEVEEVEEVEEIEESEDEKDIAIATKADERVINEKIKSNGKNDKVEEEEEEGSEEEVEEEEEEEVEEEEVEESGTSGDEVKS